MLDHTNIQDYKQMSRHRNQHLNTQRTNHPPTIAALFVKVRKKKKKEISSDQSNNKNSTNQRERKRERQRQKEREEITLLYIKTLWNITE
jgi:hypothetical protein